GVRMKKTWIALFVGQLFFLPCLQAVARAQDENCGQVIILRGIARATSVANLIKLERKAAQNYQLQVAFAARRLELNPKSRTSASALLALIPQNVDQHAAWITFGDSMCENESSHDMNLLDLFGSRLEHDLTTAVLLVPGKMSDYVGFAFEALMSPESDYAVEMQRVCKSKHAELMQAINTLPSEDRTRLVRYILDPYTCKALKLPEAGWR
ncbi:MAG: hypothetical protein ACRD27_05715, partial [Terracidiphilus sp.]